MRLRLKILRHNLPQANVIWTVAEGSSGFPCSVAGFLEQVNEIFPLVSGSWGLEDYVVELDGFECLHFRAVTEVFKDEDIVVIRPLETPEHRARHISGRYQISTAGARLVDGIPFGRRYIRQPRRPGIDIPSNDREQFPLTEGQDLSIYEEDDDDVSLRGLIGNTGGDDAERLEVSSALGKRKRSDSVRSVRFDAADTQLEPRHEKDDDDDDDDDEDDSEFNLSSADQDEISQDTDEDTSDSESEASSTTTSSSSSDDSSDSIPDLVASLDGVLEAAKAKLARRDQGEGSIQVTPIQPELLQRVKEVAVSKVAATESPQPGQVSQTPPGKGKLETQLRNARKRDSRKLRQLKEQGLIHPEATISDMKAMGLGAAPAANSIHAAPLAAPSARKPKAVPEPPEPTASNHIEMQANEAEDSDAPSEEVIVKSRVNIAPTQEAEPAAERKGKGKKEKAKKKKARSESTEEEQAVGDRTENGTVQADAILRKDTADGAPNEPVVAIGERQTVIRPKNNLELPGPAADAEAPTEDVATEDPDADEPEETEQPPLKRSRLDVAGSRRLLFGSLGIRTPKTPEEEEEARAKLLAQAQRPGLAKLKQKLDAEKATIAGAESELVDPTSDGWQDKIDLSAVECVDEGIELSTPPYPFTNLWDPQYATKRKKSKKRKRKSNYEDDFAADVEETYEYETEAVDDSLYYDEFPEGGLNYDEVDDAGKDHSSSDQQETVKVTRIRGDFSIPAVPKHTSKYPALSKDHLAPGTIILFKQLDCSEATNWAPIVSDYRTARIESVEDNGMLSIRLAAEYIPRKTKRFVGGKRVFSGFEGMGDDDEDEDEDDGVRDVAFAELLEAQLLEAGKQDDTRLSTENVDAPLNSAGSDAPISTPMLETPA